MIQLPDLSLLQALVVTSEEPSLAAAARRLGISQPTLSYQLGRLEAHFRTPIFEYDGKRKILTRYGRAIRELAEKQLRHFAEGLRDIDRSYSDPMLLTLRVGCRIDRIAWVRRMILFPGEIEIQDLSSDKALDAVLEHRIDIGVVHERPQHPDLICRKLFRSTNRFVVHKDLLGKMPIEKAAKDPDFLARTPVIRYRTDEPLIAKWLKVYGGKDLLARYRLSCPHWATLAQWVAEREGYAIVPADLSFSHPDVVSLDLSEEELPGLTFYAVFFQELKKISGFSKGIQFLTQ